MYKKLLNLRKEEGRSGKIVKRAERLDHLHRPPFVTVAIWAVGAVASGAYNVCECVLASPAIASMLARAGR
jgi:hypothetical protein